MSSWILWLIFVLAEAALIFFCVSATAPAIQTELSLKSLEALRARNLDLGDGFVMDGRDAWLTGAAPSEAERARAGLALAEIAGVHAVHNLLKAGNAPVREKSPSTPEVPPPAAAPTRSPTPTSRSDIQRLIDDLIAGRVVEFESGRDRLTAGGGALVDELATLLLRHPDAHIAIAGHTDSQGTARNNLALSRKRAASVRTRLIAGGVQESRVTASGYGEEHPIADNSTSKGRVRNRRVEFTVE